MIEIYLTSLESRKKIAATLTRSSGSLDGDKGR